MAATENGHEAGKSTMTVRKAPARKAAKTARPAEDPIRFGVLTDAIGFYLRLAQEASFQSFMHRGRHLRLRPGRFATLVIIGENPGMSQTALGRAAGRDKSSLTPALDELERRGLIRRERVPDNRRSYALSLTPKGRKWLDELMVPMRLHERDLDAAVGSANRALFLRILKQIASSMP